MVSRMASWDFDGIDLKVSAATRPHLIRLPNVPTLNGLAKLTIYNVDPLYLYEPSDTEYKVGRYLADIVIRTRRSAMT